MLYLRYGTRHRLPHPLPNLKQLRPDVMLPQHLFEALIDHLSIRPAGECRPDRNELALLRESGDKLRVVTRELIVSLLEECRGIPRSALTCQITAFCHSFLGVDVDCQAADVLLDYEWRVP